MDGEDVMNDGKGEDGCTDVGDKDGELVAVGDVVREFEAEFRVV